MSRYDDLNERTLARFGKPVGDCTWRELQALIVELTDTVTGMVADVDRADAALAEAEPCGCLIAVPLLPDGSPDIGRGVVRHTCGRAG